jgi:hypothetical protein
VKEITQEEFDFILAKIVSELGVHVLRVPGVYEILAEHFTKQVLEVWEAWRQFELKADQAPEWLLEVAIEVISEKK